MLQHNQKMWELERLKEQQLLERKMLGKEVIFAKIAYLIAICRF